MAIIGRNDADYARIVADLDRLAGDAIFDLSAGLGDEAIGDLVASITQHFDHETDADGVRWPDLAPATVREKARLYPGKPILVRTGTLREGLPGDRTIAPDVAIYTFGTNDVNRAEADYAEQGDPLANRPPRRFVDLTAEATAQHDAMFDRSFDTHFPQ